jgi:hypothetical protein
VDYLIQHNTIDARNSNSAVIIGADQSAINNAVVKDNILAGGNYTTYAGTGGFDSGIITFTGNRYVRDTWRYGPCSFLPSAGRTIGFVNNVWDDTGASMSCATN